MMERPDLKATTRFKKAVMTAVGAVVPSGALDNKGEYVVESYTETYNCCPPPLFIIIISAVEVCVFLSIFFGLCSCLCELLVRHVRYHAVQR